MSINCINISFEFLALNVINVTQTFLFSLQRFQIQMYKDMLQILICNTHDIKNHLLSYVCSFSIRRPIIKIPKLTKHCVDSVENGVAMETRDLKPFFPGILFSNKFWENSPDFVVIHWISRTFLVVEHSCTPLPRLLPPVWQTYSNFTP